jgi:2,3-bisphosphoglycerate-independent phosphoglycerate mutase
MLAYNAMLGKCDNTFIDPLEYVKQNYEKQIYDEFMPCGICLDKDVFLNNNDSVIFANYRPDRARELSHLIFNSNLYDYKVDRKQNLYFVTMMSYEGIVPSAIAYPPKEINNIFGQVLANNNVRQLRIAETEKYAHVTFFFDGGKEFILNKMDKIVIASPKVATYDLAPEMSANKISDKIVEVINNYDVIIVNYANGDMVGHTGNIDASIKAIETLDKQLKTLLDLSIKNDFTLFVTADHGNVEEANHTQHTINPVPLIITDKNIKSIQPGVLGNIAPTVLKYLGIEIPNEMLKPLI